MAPIQSNPITLIIRNRTQHLWRWQSISTLDANSEKQSLSFEEILANGRSTIKCQSDSDHIIQASLTSLPGTEKKKLKQQHSPINVDIKLNVKASASSGWGCFGRGGKNFNDCSWTAYATPLEEGKKIRLFYRQTSLEHFDILIIPSMDSSCFLSSLPDQSFLSTICIPGTHESLARYGWPISTCQSSESVVSKQLQDGIRYLDIRLVPKGEPGQIRLLAYHGITDERIEFGAVLQQCWEFLNDSKTNRETIIMSIKQESGDQDLFIKTLFDTYVNQMPSNCWFLENRIPTLGEVRGKIVMLSRFVIAPSYGFQGGISPPIWPNSLKGIFNYTLSSGQNVITQDWYDIGSLNQIGEKLSLIEQLSSTSKQNPTNNQTFALNYTNGSSFPFALPPYVAKGINTPVRDFVADIHFDSSPPNKRNQSGALSGLQITWAIDYYDGSQGAQDLVPLLIAANFNV